VHSPLLPARRVSEVVSSLDLAPTIVSFSGSSLRLPFLGHSLLPKLLGAPAPLPEVRFAQFYISEDLLRGRDPLRLVSARTNQYNVIFDRRTGTLQAYDWKHDPEERRDVFVEQADAMKPTPATSVGARASSERADSVLRITK